MRMLVPGETSVSPSVAVQPVYPLTITDDQGTKVTLQSEPQRIIGLSPAITETLFALGAGNREVGGTDADDYPPEAAALPDVVSQTHVLMEKVVALYPDLIIAAGDGFTPPAAITRMRDLGYPVMVVYAQSVDQVLSDIDLIGQAVGDAPAATQITTQMQSATDQISAVAATAASKPRTFYEIGYGPDIYAPAPKSFIADLVTLAGGDPITTGDPAAYSMSLEKLVAADPQVIVLGDALYGTCPADVAARAGWEHMTAVVNGAIRPVNDTVVTRPGPRLPQGLALLTAAIHPELILPLPVPALSLCGAPGASASPGTSTSPGGSASPHSSSSSNY